MGLIPRFFELLCCSFTILAFSQLVTIADSIGVYYYLFDGVQVSHKWELVQIVERSLCMREVLGSIPRFSSH